MKIPERLKIGYRVYRLKLIDTGMFDGNLGHIRHLEEIIHIKKSQTDIEVIDTILHECVHSILHLNDRYDMQEEEKVVSVLAHGLTELFRRNPELLTWLVENMPSED